LPQAILFDLDETLVDRRASLEPYLRRLYDRLCLSPDGWTSFQRRFEELDQGGYADREAVFRSLTVEFGVPVPVADLVAEFEHTAWWGARTFSGTNEVLNELRRRGYRLGIVTNGSVATQGEKLLRAGLASKVDAVVISEAEGVKKPAPKIFQASANRLGAPLRECWFVGDHPEKDVDGARRAGMVGVWLRGEVAWPKSLKYPDYTIDSLAELLDLVP
jgi:putative hydrolase of the HAD superfamily